jgi:hypothetical protein
MLSATVEDLINVTHICDESQILRKQISDITISDDEYPVPEEVSISNSGPKLPSSLKIFTCWLLDVDSRAHKEKKKNICNASPKWKEVNLFLLTDTMHSAI